MQESPLKFFIVFVLAFSFTFAQNVKIKGKAHSSHIGKPVNLYSYSDLITLSETREATDTVDKEGYFELQVQIANTQPVLVKIDNLSGKLYIQPDFVYGITFPEKDSSVDRRGETEIPVQVGVLSADTTELNTLIIDFNNVYNQLFDAAQIQFLNRNRIFQKIDTLKLITAKRYQAIKNEYFRGYVEYTIAEINSNASRGKNYLTNNYITGKPIQYRHYEYMTFFNAFFKGYLNAYTSTKGGESVYHIINTRADYKALVGFLKSDELLKNETLRELVTIRNLWDYYFDKQFERQQVVAVIEQFWNETKIPEHRKIADNILQIAYDLQPGAAAPVFTAVDRAGKKVSLNDFKGRYIYINFFSTRSISSLKEMPKILELNKKYADKMVFISICTDDSLKTYKEFLRANPKYTWTILFNNSETKGKTAKDLYKIKGLPAFFFINNYGNLVQSPAIAPTQGFESKLKGVFKVKKGNTKTGIR
jgi:thiol-disulfide isomerase/thioredoxin